MRIVLSNPDNLGDFILRQPMVAALTNEGHELLLVVRSTVSPLASLVAPAATVVQFDLDPYDGAFDRESKSLLPLVGQIGDFKPDLIAVAPYQRTWLDETIVERFRSVPSIGLSGYLYRGDINAGHDFKSEIAFSKVVSVSEADHELRKNELLCSGILGRSISLPAPTLSPSETSLYQARTRLNKLGLQSQKYWVVCAGDTPWSAVRNLGTTEWAEVLSAAVKQHNIDLLFLGLPDEHSVTEEIRAKMGTAAARSYNICSPGEGLDLLIGLIAESAGYFGRDTGPMHMAAALSKPVVAVFGAGHWPRFVPAARQGGVVTVRVPCSGCNWICHLSESHCIKRVPVQAVLEELAKAISGAAEFHVREVLPDRVLENRMAVEAAEAAWSLMRRKNALSRRLEAQAELLAEERQSNASLKMKSDELSRALEVSEQKLVDCEFAQQNVTEQAQKLQSEYDKLASLLAALKSDHSQLSGELCNLRTDYDTLRRAHDALNHDHADATGQLAAIRRSPFTKLLVLLRIWRIWR